MGGKNNTSESRSQYYEEKLPSSLGAVHTGEATTEQICSNTT